MNNIDIEKKGTSTREEKAVNNRDKMNGDALKVIGMLCGIAGVVIKVINDKRIQFILRVKEDNMPNTLRDDMDSCTVKGLLVGIVAFAIKAGINIAIYCAKNSNN